MALFGMCSNAMMKFGNVLSRRHTTWRSASGRQLARLDPLASAPALNLRRDPMIESQENKSVLLSSLKSLVDEDINDIHQKAIKMLREHITNDELFDIATYFYTKTNEGIFVWTSAFICLAKALNYHLFNDATLRDNQRKLITLIEVSILSYLLHDDINDNAITRFKLPSAHVIWDRYKVIMAGNLMLIATTVEAAKLGNDVAVNLSLTHERQYRGQYMESMTTMPTEDRLTQYLSMTDYKAGSPNSYCFRAIAKICGARDLLIDSVTRLGFNNSMFLQLVDDIKDVETDLRDGLATATVILAMREHPVLEEMIIRRFQEEGDVEEAMKLVISSQGKEEAKNLARGYYTQAMVLLDMLADSPYREALETVFRLQFERKINTE